MVLKYHLDQNEGYSRKYLKNGRLIFHQFLINVEYVLYTFIPTLIYHNVCDRSSPNTTFPSAKFSKVSSDPPLSDVPNARVIFHLYCSAVSPHNIKMLISNLESEKR